MKRTRTRRDNEQYHTFDSHEKVEVLIVHTPHSVPPCLVHQLCGAGHDGRRGHDVHMVLSAIWARCIGMNSHTDDVKQFLFFDHLSFTMFKSFDQWESC